MPNDSVVALSIARKWYETRGVDFEFVISDSPGIGYYIEPWTNECLSGTKLTSNQPGPVFLDQSEASIIEQEAEIRLWIGTQAHPLVVADLTRRSPPGWKLVSDMYDADFGHLEFGASVLAFRVNDTPIPPTQS